MKIGALLFILGFLALSTLAFSDSVDALGYGYGMYPGMMGSLYSYGAYGSSYGSPSYGYAGPYSYQFVPRSFWGHYYNPGLYYSTMDYSLRNNLLDYNQRNLAMTYGFISQSGNLY